MPTEFVMLPPQTDKTREWGAQLAAALPEMKVIVAENHTHAAQVIARVLGNDTSTMRAHAQGRIGAG